MTKVTLNVGGMTCDGCVRSIKNVLEPVSGVSKVEISLEKGEVTVEFDEQQAREDRLRLAIEDAGYDVLS